MPNSFHPFLLDALCADDRDEAIRLYLRLHEKLESYFRLKGMYDPLTDADETFTRAEAKLEKGQDIPDIRKFCMGIARNIVHERLRERQHEQDAYLNYIKNRLDNNLEAVLDTIINLMKPCFEQLPKDDQDLLMEYCKVLPGVDRAEHRRKFAARLNLSISALRIRVTRLRRALENCVRERRKRQ